MGAEVSPRDGDDLVAPGDLLEGRYRVEATIGRGGMGTVFAALDLVTGERVAIKSLCAGGDEAELAQRLVREARAVSEVQSDHVARVHHVGKLAGGAPFLALELLSGETLDVFERKHRPVPIDRGVDLILEACEGLAAAHAAGIIHRDIKPSNLFVALREGGGTVLKILDFGISKTADALLPGELDTPTLTSTGATLGSPRYMSPEQIRNARAVDARTDVFSTGVVLHKLLSGRLPFEAETLAAYAAMIAADPPTPLRRHRQDAPEALERIVLRCLEKKPERRWPSIAAFAIALEPFASAAGKEIVARLARDHADAATVSSDGGDPRDMPEPATVGAFTRGRVSRTKARSSLKASLTFAVAAALGASGAIAVFVSRAKHAEDAMASAPVATAAMTTAATTAPTPTRATVRVHLRLRVDPPNAAVTLDSAPVTTDEIEIEAGSRHTIEARANGYDTETREIAPDVDGDVSIALRRAKRGATPARAQTTLDAPPPAPPAPPPPAQPSAKPKLKPLMEQTL